MTIVITDPTLPLNVNGLSINMFKPKLQDFPDIQIGDIVKCCFKTNVFGRRIQGVVSRHSPEYVKILTEGSLDMNLLDSTIFSNLKGWYNSLKDSSMIPKKTFESKRPLLQVKDIQVGQFFDLVCKIVCKPNRSNNFQILGITDYTCNIQLLEPPLLLESEDLMGIQENMVIVCTLWDQYSTFHGIEVGSLVLLRNLKGKLDINGRLEVALNGDQFEPYHFIKLLSYQSPEIQTLKSLEMDYQNHDGIQNNQIPTSITLDHKYIKPNEISKINMILKSQTLNQIFKVNVKVVDYMPMNIQHFTRPLCDHCFETVLLNLGHMICPKCKSMDDYTFHYLFSLLITDGTGYLPLIVTGTDAINFFDGTQPCDLTIPNEHSSSIKKSLSRLWNVNHHGVTDAIEFSCFIKIDQTLVQGESKIRYKLVNTKL
ncbi:hypothetical protein BC833DRAFT_576717 [Globomyces pollinis-pini]|nr:hypothetical protein BC833DRAFT_576717 [Globomyces pollinis-pini]